MRHSWFFRGAAILAICVLLLSDACLAAGRPRHDVAGATTPAVVGDAFTVDLNGSWLMIDCTKGMGVGKELFVPRNQPRACLPIQVPGTVRTALLADSLIPDPYFGYDNEKSLWVEDKEWWFYRTFPAAEELRGKRVDLVFEGASFQGEVWLNGRRVGELKGMLNPRAFDVSELLKIGGDNTLAVRLEATPDARQNETARELTWFTNRPQLYSIAQCMYGWDWGPHGVPVGMWRPVRLRVSGALRIDHPYIRSELFSSSQAVCTVAVDVRNLSSTQHEAEITGAILDGDPSGRRTEFHKGVTLEAGVTKTVTFKIKVWNPRLWWPNGMGEQNLYSLQASVTEGGNVSDRLTTQFGIRELKLVENEQVGEFLKSLKESAGNVYQLGKVVGSYPWTFLVNGKKMFAKGGNWIPIDELLRLDRDRYDRLLKLAKEAHFNLLRVWGGGLYETDDFYELCDKYGILSWQEFLSNQSFSKIDRGNFLEGANEAVLRLRNHPSLTFWCGGNEFDPDDHGSKAVVDALDSLVKKLDPQREFHRASPYMGDDHHWGVWHGGEPYSRYRIVRPFRSEAGMNTFPVSEDYRLFTPDSLLWPPDTTFIEFHGEYNTRFQHLAKLSRYSNEFGPPTGINDLIMKSELYQALSNAFNMEFCRSNKFRNSGLLVWQYNDIWPCLSWSMVDWYGTPKPSYYFQARASRPVHISADYERYLWKAGETFRTDVFLLNDTEAPVEKGTYEVRLLDVRGKILAQKSGPAACGANTSVKIGVIELPLSQEMAGRTFFVSVQLAGGDGARISEALYPIAVSGTGNLDDYNSIFAEMNRMPPVQLGVDLTGLQMQSRGTGTWSVRLSNPSESLAFFSRVRLLEESRSIKSYYSDNDVSLLPHESKTISVRVEAADPGSVPATLHVEFSGWNSPVRTVELRVTR